MPASSLPSSGARGSHLYTADGERYLDFGCGIGVTSLGHAHPHVVAALEAQSRQLWHVSNLYEIPPQARLAERLTAATFADRVLFCNSGAEAMECALKLARIYQTSRGAPERYRVVTFRNAFHGRTLATIAAGGQAKHLKGFEPAIDAFDQVDLNDLDATRAAIGDETAALLVEPVQGRGRCLSGQRRLPAGLTRARRRGRPRAHLRRGAVRRGAHRAALCP